MRALIRADLRRIRRRLSFKVIMIILLLWQFLDMIQSEETSEVYLSNADRKLGTTYLLIVTIFVFLNVFADDHKSNTYASVIGTGMKRRTLLLAKVMDCAVLTGIYYIAMTLFRNFLYLLLDVPLSARQRHTVFLIALFAALRGISYLIISMLVLYLTDSTAAALTADVVIVMFVGRILKFVQTAYHIGIYDFMLDGLFENAMANISVGRLPWQIIPAAAVYFCGAFAAAAFVFEKKELQL